MTIKFHKTKHFRLDEGLDNKLTQLSQSTHRNPSQMLRELIATAYLWQALEGESEC